MIAQTAHLVLSLSFDVELECIGAGRDVGKHEILPHHDAELITQGVELICLVIATSPVANHVHVGVARRLKDSAVICRSDAARKAVEWNDIGALGKDGDTVHNEFKRPPPLIELAAELNRTEPRLDGAFRGDLVRCADLGSERIEELFAVTSRVPEPGMPDTAIKRRSDGGVDWNFASLSCQPLGIYCR